MASQGKLVEYIEHGKFYCAFVMEGGEKRLRLINQNGREVSLPAGRVLHASIQTHPVARSREELMRDLHAAAERRAGLQLEVDLETVWALAVESGQAALSPAFLAELCFGAGAADNEVAATLRAVFEDRLFFKYKEGMVFAHSQEVVESLRERQEKERRQELLLAEGARALAALWAGQDTGACAGLDEILGMLARFYLHGTDFPDHALVQEMLKKAELVRPHDPYHLLVKAGYWRPHENIPLLRQDLPRTFSAEEMEEAECLVAGDFSAEALLAEGRRDLRHLRLITIDGDSTRDHDDAIHVEPLGDGFRVGVHIADVARYAHPAGRLFRAAEERVTSLYFAEEQVPMLPPSISEGICSLFAGQAKAALSFLIHLSPSGEVRDFEVVRSVVEVKEQLTYTVAESRMEEDRDLALLLQLSRKLRQRRIASGALILPIPDVVVSISEEDQVRVQLLDVEGPGRSLVAEFMVLANTVGAQYLADRQVPGIFRTQDLPHRRLVEQPQKELFINFLQRKFLSPGGLSTEPKLHSGVGVMHYSTFTSPIRRFLDLVMQHQLCSVMSGKGAMFRQEQMSDWIAVIQRGQGKANLVCQLRHRYWLLRMLEGRGGGERLSAFVLNRGPKRVVVVLTELLLECELPPNPAMHMQPGDMVRVRVAKVNALDNQLRLEW